MATGAKAEPPALPPLSHPIQEKDEASLPLVICFMDGFFSSCRVNTHFRHWRLWEDNRIHGNGGGGGGVLQQRSERSPHTPRSVRADHLYSCGLQM